MALTTGVNYQAGKRYVELQPDESKLKQDEALQAHFEERMIDWAMNPVHYVCEVLQAQPDPWQCDVLDAIAEPGIDNIALRACHGPGKTALLAWVVNWFAPTRPYCKIPTTAPTFNKQVRDILWAEIHKWWRTAQENQDSPEAQWLTSQFELTTTRLYHKDAPNEWFAVGIASSEPLNIEGYHSPHLLAIFDEAKGIKKPIWESVQGMRTTQEAKFLVASTPGGPLGEFYKVFTQYRSTWKHTFVVHPRALEGQLKRKEALPYSRGGTYYSDRVRIEWLNERAEEWGTDSPAFIARCIGDFPSIEGDVLIPYAWLADAEDLEEGRPGDLGVVSCDVARYGRDRTIIFAGIGGTLTHGESIARTPAESLSPDATDDAIGPDRRHPRYRSVDATADACRRVRQVAQADCIVVDDTGVGGGVTDILRRKGERVIPINFGSMPTDKPKDADERATRQRKHLLDSKFVNLKAEMGWALRSAFEQGFIALGRLPAQLKDALMAQCSMVKYELDQSGRIRIVDPDEQDTLAAAAGTLEGRKSPDHFHSLLLYWWVAGNIGRGTKPLSGRPGGGQSIPHGIKRLGQSHQTSQAAAHPNAPRIGGGGQAGWVRRRY